MVHVSASALERLRADVRRELFGPTDPAYETARILPPSR